MTTLFQMSLSSTCNLAVRAAEAIDVLAKEIDIAVEAQQRLAPKYQRWHAQVQARLNRMSDPKLPQQEYDRYKRELPDIREKIDAYDNKARVIENCQRRLQVLLAENDVRANKARPSVKTFSGAVAG